MAYEESILGLSSIYLFGRVVSDLSVVTNDPDEADRPAQSGSNKFLREQFKHPAARLARIFSFAFEGTMYDLSRPSLFLVQGTGDDIDAPLPAGVYARLARAPGRISRTGVGWQDGEFSMDMRVWVYDKGDFSMRLDVESGTFDQILLDAELDDDFWGSSGRSGSGRSGSGRSGNGRSGSGRSGNGRSGNGRSGS